MPHHSFGGGGIKNQDIKDMKYVYFLHVVATRKEETLSKIESHEGIQMNKKIQTNKTKTRKELRIRKMLCSFIAADITIGVINFFEILQMINLFSYV